MSRTPIQKRGRLFRGSLLCAFVASLVLGLVVEGHLHAAHADGNGGNNLAKNAFIVILDGGHPQLYNPIHAPFLTSVKHQRASSTNAHDQEPPTTITNNMRPFTDTH